MVDARTQLSDRHRGRLPLAQPRIAPRFGPASGLNQSGGDRSVFQPASLIGVRAADLAPQLAPSPLADQPLRLSSRCASLISRLPSPGPSALTSPWSLQDDSTSAVAASPASRVSLVPAPSLPQPPSPPSRSVEPTAGEHDQPGSPQPAIAPTIPAVSPPPALSPDSSPAVPRSSELSESRPALPNPPRQSLEPLRAIEETDLPSEVSPPPPLSDQSGPLPTTDSQPMTGEVANWQAIDSGSNQGGLPVSQSPEPQLPDSFKPAANPANSPSGSGAKVSATDSAAHPLVSTADGATPRQQMADNPSQIFPKNPESAPLNPPQTNLPSFPPLDSPGSPTRSAIAPPAPSPQAPSDTADPAADTPRAVAPAAPAAHRATPLPTAEATVQPAPTAALEPPASTAAQMSSRLIAAPTRPASPVSRLVPPAVSPAGSLSPARFESVPIRSLLADVPAPDAAGGIAPAANYSQPLSPSPPSPSPPVEVTIGRIDVRVTPTPPAAKRPRRSPQPPALSLKDYLDRRHRP